MVVDCVLPSCDDGKVNGTSDRRAGHDRNPPSPPRLLDRLRHACRVRHFSIRTEDAYAAAALGLSGTGAAQNRPSGLSAFTASVTRRSMREPEVNTFLTHLAVDRNVSASTQNQALAALLFLYEHVLDKPLDRIEGVVRANRPRRLPVVLTRGEVAPRAATSSTARTDSSGELMYGAGLRLMECLRLRVKDLDFERGEITVREGKGDKDRRTDVARRAIGLA